MIPWRSWSKRKIYEACNFFCKFVNVQQCLKVEAILKSIYFITENQLNKVRANFFDIFIKISSSSYDNKTIQLYVVRKFLFFYFSSRKAACAPFLMMYHQPPDRSRIYSDRTTGGFGGRRLYQNETAAAVLSSRSSVVAAALALYAWINSRIVYARSRN